MGAIFVENKVSLAVAGNPTESDSELHSGLDVLAGIKHALTRNWAVGIQYNHDVIAQKTYTFGPGFTASGQGSAWGVLRTLVGCSAFFSARADDRQGVPLAPASGGRGLFVVAST